MKKRKILKYNNFMVNEEYTSREENLINSILDKISEVGYNNLSAIEKEILNKYSNQESIEKYLPPEDKVNITFDNKGMLFNGMPYEEYQRKLKTAELDDDKDDKTGFKRTSKSKSEGKGQFTGSYRINVYKNFGSKDRIYYIFHEDGKKQKFYTISDNEKDIFGKKTTLKTWTNLSPEEVHEKYLDKEFHQWRALTPGELTEFETFLILRERWKNGEFNDYEKNEASARLLQNLVRLYKKFSNI
jgi:hypothetical protein